MSNECLLCAPTNFPFRPFTDIRCRKLVAPKLPVAQTPWPPKVTTRQLQVERSTTGCILRSGRAGEQADHHGKLQAEGNFHRPRLRGAQDSRVTARHARTPPVPREAPDLRRRLLQDARSGTLVCQRQVRDIAVNAAAA